MEKRYMLIYQAEQARAYENNPEEYFDSGEVVYLNERIKEDTI